MELDRAACQASLEEAAHRVRACRRCAIGEQRRNAVFGEGDPSARVMLVGEGPGETEDALGRPFVGRAGALLDRMLGAIGLARDQVYICNTVKCRPTSPGPRGPRNRAPEPSEMENCRPFLDEQIATIRPAVIVALGAAAAKSFLGRDFLISKQRGRWYEGPAGAALIATFHPAYLLRQTGGELEAVKRLVWHDLLQVRARLDEVPVPHHAPPTQVGLFEEGS